MNHGHTVLGSLAAALGLCAGCSAPLFTTTSPTLAELERGEVHTSRIKGTDEEDIYRTVYVVNLPADVVWETALEIRTWMRNARVVERISPRSDSSSDTGAESELFVIEWQDGPTQQIVFTSDELTREIQIAVEPDSVGTGRLAHCRIRVSPFLDRSALVRVEMRMSSSFEHRLADILLVFVKVFDENSVEARLHRFMKQLADEHRSASERAFRPPAPETGRTHIVAIGVDKLDAHEAWLKDGVEELRWAQRDAEAFFEWANTVEPEGRTDDEVIRLLLVGSKATSRQLRKVIVDLLDDGPEGRVRSGDTVLLFFSGHIALEADPLAPGDHRGQDRYAHLVTTDSEPGRYLPSTAVRRDDLLDALRRSKASTCVMLYDACYSGGPRVRSVASLGSMALRARGEPVDAGVFKTAILAAAQRFSLAAESDELEHGVFSSALLEGLGGAADTNADQQVTIEELWEYVENEVPRLTQHRQVPYIYLPPSEGLRTLAWPVNPSLPARSSP